MMRQGLARLAQIAIFALMAAILATVAAIGAMIWQRPQLAKLKLDGFSCVELSSTLLLEELLLLGEGGVSGSLVGPTGQQPLDRALPPTTPL